MRIKCAWNTSITDEINKLQANQAFVYSKKEVKCIDIWKIIFAQLYL